MKTILFIFIILANLCFGQDDLNRFNSERSKTDQKLMLTLGSWSTTNMIVSGAAWVTLQEGEARYFHQMNVMWNVVNLGLAIPGYIKARNASTDISFARTWSEQSQTEKVFLFNGALDIAYMTSGMLLREMAQNDPSRAEIFNGFGNGLLLQGGFLFVFDLAAYGIHKIHANRKLSPLFDKMELSQSGIGIRYNLN